ncbi:MAG: PilN domain-containing protein [Nitrospinota bacterium]
MQKLAVIDIKESFCCVSVFSEGWGSNTLLGTATVRGSFTDKNGMTARRVMEELENISSGIDATILLLPRKLAQLSSLEIPARNKRVVKKMMEFEASRHFPIPPDQLAYDFFHADKKGERYILNLAGLKKSDFETYYKAATDAGIKPDVVSVSSSAWLAPRGKETGKRTFIEIVPDGFEMSLLDGYTISYSRFVRFRPAIEEKYFHDPGYSAETVTSEIVKAVGGELDHVKLVSGIEGLDEYLANVRIVGGGNLRKRIANSLALEKDFSSSTISALPESDSETGFDQTAIAAGEADWDREGLLFNFIPQEMRRPRHDIEKKRMQVLTAVGACLLVLWGVSSFAMQYRSLSGLKNELVQLKIQAKALDSAEIRIDEYMSYFNEFSRFSNGPAFNLQIMDALTNTISRNTFLTGIEMRKGEIGVAGLSAASSGLLKALEDSIYFKNVRMEGAVKTVGNRERFKLRMDIE